MRPRVLGPSWWISKVPQGAVEGWVLTALVYKGLPLKSKVSVSIPQSIRAMSNLDARSPAPALTPSQLEQGSPSNSTRPRPVEDPLRFEPLAPQSIKRKVPRLRRCASVLSIYPQDYNLKVVSPQNSQIPAGPPPSQQVEPMPNGWDSHRHPYGHGYYTQEDDDTPMLRLVTYSGPETSDTLDEARREILTSLKKHGGTLPPRSHLVVVLYNTERPQTGIRGGYYFADLEQKVIFWYISQHSVLSFGLDLTSNL